MSHSWMKKMEKEYNMNLQLFLNHNNKIIGAGCSSPVNLNLIEEKKELVMKPSYTTHSDKATESTYYSTRISKPSCRTYS